MNRESTNAAYTKSFCNLTKEFTSRFTGTESIDSYLQKHAFFITLQFNSKRIKDRLDELAWPAEHWRKEEIALANFNQLYCQISRALIGKNYSRSKFLDVRPFAIAAVDYAGTRTNSYTIVERKSDLHVHAFVVVASDHREKMRTYLSNTSARFRLRDSDQLDCTVHLKRYEGDAQSVLSYATKYLGFDASTNSSTFPYRIYPESFYSDRFVKPEALTLVRRSKRKEWLLHEARREWVAMQSRL